MKVIIHKRQKDRRYEMLKQCIINAIKTGQLSKQWLKIVEEIEIKKEE